MSISGAIYTCVAYALLPLALLRLAWRASRMPEYGEHWLQRLGHYDAQPMSGPLIWIHAVSVGETRGAEPLVRALLDRYPNDRILLTCTTPTGRRAAGELFGDRVLRAYLPYDYPHAVARFLDHYRPRLGLLMETEVWPNLIRACSARGVPLYLVNARLSDKSFRRYGLVAPLARETFGALSAVAAQTEEDAARLRALGAREVAVTGNLKFDVAPSTAHIELGRAWRTRYGDRPVLLAASTRDGEEERLLDALDAFTVPRLLLIIVPRHPQRFDEVAALLERRGVPYERRSADRQIPAGTKVVLGDSMGEMAAHYAACDLAFIGGSLLPFGGQNLIEACAVGKPVLLGPHTYNFAEAATHAIDAGAAVRVGSASELAREASALMNDRQALARMGERALAFSRAHQGATARVMSILRI